ncbi:MAG: hypothetical protein KDC98_19600 [Planctomycetes bacterium]|nr:hypothetical protein [Planctomycetota bacterium]
MLIERAVVVQDPSQGTALRRVPEGPGPVSPSLLQIDSPRFDPAVMFPNVGGIRFGSFSGGTSVIVADVEGHADITGATQWGYLYLAVSGANSGSHPQFQSAAAGPGGIAADTFNYVFTGSSLAGDYVGILEKARDGVDMGLTDISGLDQNLAALGLAPALAGAAEALNSDFYFTVAPGSLPQVYQWFSRGNPSSATIFKIQWSETTQQWSPPVEFLTYEELGLDETIEITGLAIEPAEGEVLLATSTEGMKLWFVRYEVGWIMPPLIVGPYRTGNGDDVADVLLQLGPGNHITALCASDPNTEVTALATLQAQTLAIPIEDSRTDRPCFDLAASRSRNRRTDADQVSIFVSAVSCVAGNPNYFVVTIDGIATSAIFGRISSQPPVQRFDVEIPPTMPAGPFRINCTVCDRSGQPLASTHDFEMWR